MSNRSWHSDEEMNAIIGKAVAVLTEHFDAAQLVVSYVDLDGNTHCRSVGFGNWFARVGMVEDFLQRATENASSPPMPRCIEEEDDDEEGA